jgi:hypothetical protein
LWIVGSAHAPFVSDTATAVNQPAGGRSANAGMPGVTGSQAGAREA